MRPYILGILVLCAAVRVTSAQQFPYTATIISDDVYIRSGPGKNYYPTTKMKKGDTIEVYRHDPEGWLAIRPPRGSFTWVSARYLQPTSDGLGKITGDQVAARVGSGFSDIRDVIQVRLDRNEVVEILEQKSLVGGKDAGSWYKIAPPAGEFRWVQSQCVNSPYTSADAATAPDSVQPPSAPVGSGSLSTKVVTADNWVNTRAQGSPQAAEFQAGSASTYVSPRLPELGESGSSASTGSTSVSKPFQAELNDINLDLSMMLAEEPTVWQFDALRSRAESLLDEAATAVERGAVRAVLNTIEQSADVKRRYDEVNGGPAAGGAPDPQALPTTVTRAGYIQTLPPRAEGDPGRFDGMGRLARVVTSKVGAPRYALVDPEGHVSCYVTPAPGLNLQYYVGRQVGVTGVRGYFADQNAQHITAKHVSPLGGGVR